MPGGYVAVTIPDTYIAATLYPYSANTSISENMLLPHKLNRIMQYNVKLPEGKTWIEKRNVKVSNEVGEVSVEYELSGDEVKVTYTYKVDEQLITKKNYRQFYSLMSECKDMNNTYKIDEQLITKENYRQFYSLMSECKDMNNYILLFK